MSDDLTLFSDEQAKVFQERAKSAGKAIDLLDKFGGAVGLAFGPAARNTVGLAEDSLGEVRQRNAIRLKERTRELLRERHIDPSADEVSPSLIRPVAEAAAEESRPELQELWARLLAAAMAPSRSRAVRRSFIEIVKQMEPIDALVLQKLSEYSLNPPSIRDNFAVVFKTTNDQIDLSLHHLEKLGCVLIPPAGPSATLTATGRELTRALRD